MTGAMQMQRLEDALSQLEVPDAQVITKGQENLEKAKLDVTSIEPVYSKTT